MFNSKLVTSVHLEMTDKCNASCPMCPRTDHGGPLNPNLKLTELSLNDAKVILQPEFVRQLKSLQMCGSFGDPIMAKDTLEILKYLRECNPEIILGINTNGSARSKEWWSDLGKVLSGPNDYCKFGLDGLADTNAIYRRKTSWDKIMTSAEFFIQAGGQAHWEFLVFKHNELQVAEARALSEKMGFKLFLVKKTSRFFNYKNNKIEPFPIWDENRNVIGHLHPPSSKDLNNPVNLIKALSNSDEAKKTSVQNHGKIEPKPKREISCLALNERSIYISVSGDVFPCCFIGGQTGYIESGPEGMWLLESAGPADSNGVYSINAIKNNIYDIINGTLFKAVSDTWIEDPIGTCSRTCGKNMQVISGEYG